MGNFNVISSNLNNQYNYDNASVIVTGSYNSNPTTEELLNINGSVYHKNQQGEMGDFIGNFNGNASNGTVKYSLSEMSRQDSNLVWDAIDDIEQKIKGSSSN